MATATEYVVFERAKDSTGWHSSYLGWIGQNGFGWAIGGRAGAKRFASKAEAQEAANRWERIVEAGGYKLARVVIQPATGGSECSRGTRRRTHTAD